MRPLEKLVSEMDDLKGLPAREGLAQLQRKLNVLPMEDLGSMLAELNSRIRTGSPDDRAFSETFKKQVLFAIEWNGTPEAERDAAEHA
jgi:hypothetical protein